MRTKDLLALTFLQLTNGIALNLFVLTNFGNVNLVGIIKRTTSHLVLTAFHNHYRVQRWLLLAKTGALIQRLKSNGVRATFKNATRILVVRGHISNARTGTKIMSKQLKRWQS